MMEHPYVMSLLFACGLLLVGVVLRATLKPLRVLFVPASVVGGLIGLCLIQAGLRIGAAPVINDGGELVIHDEFTVTTKDEQGRVVGTDRRDPLGPSYPLEEFGQEALPTQYTAAEVTNTLSGWPGWLIAVVFAGLLMEKPGKRFSEAVVRASRQGVVVWIIVLGQAFVGLLACALLIAPFYDVPPPFGQLIETGFAGGHGTAAAMGQLFDEAYGFAPGRDIAFLFATAGLVYGTLSGIVFINIGARRGWLRTGAAPLDAAAAAADFRPDAPPDSPQPSAFARIRGEIIDPFAFQLCILAAAFAVGYAMQQLFLWLAPMLVPGDYIGFAGNIPLFLFTLLGGWLVREGMHLVGIGDLIDARSIHRLTGIAMEFLIVAALATLRIEAAAAFLWPVILLLVIGFAWTGFCLLWLSRRLLPKDYWFELGLINYGMSTATTAQGLLLLRIVDPDLESGAAEDYAAAAPLSAPFIGGGVLTVFGIPVALSIGGYWPVLAMMAIVLVGLYVLGRTLAQADDRARTQGFEVQ